jgi:hypothetical protein
MGNKKGYIPWNKGVKTGQIPWNKGLKGIHLSPDSEFKKGTTPWIKGKKGEEYGNIPSGEKHPNWKGVDAKYGTKHDWVERHFGKPTKCEMCLTTNANKFEWANISGKYKREKSDWIRLCTSCHMKFDNIHQKIWVSRRRKRCV